MLEVLNYVNFVGSLFGCGLYLFNAIRCVSPIWRTYKFMLGGSLFIIATVYLMFIMRLNVDPIVIRLNTTFFILLMICNGILGRSKYGKRY